MSKRRKADTEPPYRPQVGDRVRLEDPNHLDHGAEGAVRGLRWNARADALAAVEVHHHGVGLKRWPAEGLVKIQQPHPGD